MKSIRFKSLLALFLAAVLLPVAFAVKPVYGSESATTVVTNAAPKRNSSSTTHSEDAIIRNLHWLGQINGQTNIFRCACPVMDVAEQMKIAKPTEEDLILARERMQHLRDLGVRTVISFQHQDSPKENETNVEHIAVALEQIAAKEVGLAYVAYPMSNKGKNSFEDMTDDAVIKLLDPISEDIFKFAKTGGVAFHCKSGKDRTGIMAGYLRLKYQHWTVDEAIAEMRRYGHAWNKFAKDAATNSWHENHLRAIANILNPPAP
jgi:predicted ArsR family transcriptional regulator